MNYRASLRLLLSICGCFGTNDVACVVDIGVVVVVLDAACCRGDVLRC